MAAQRTLDGRTLSIDCNEIISYVPRGCYCATTRRVLLLPLLLLLLLLLLASRVGGDSLRATGQDTAS